MEDIFFQILACPKCKTELNIKKDGKQLSCPVCGANFVCLDNIFILLDVENIDAFKEKESQFHTKIAENADDAHCLSSPRIKYLHDDFLNPIRKQIPYMNSIILDIACGSGIDLINLCAEGYSVVGVDIAFGMCKVTLEKIQKLGLDEKAIFCQADAESLPFLTNTFNAAYISAALHHFKYPEKALNELKRVVKPDGLIAIGSEPNSWQYTFRKLKYSAFGKKLLRIFRDDFTIEGGSPGDFETIGFNQKSLNILMNSVGLEVTLVRSIWYIKGFFSLLGITPPPRIERVLIFINQVFSVIPIIIGAGWHWNLV